MNANEPSLFDIHDQEPAALPDRPQPGRNRETWACTVTAEVTVIDAAAVRDAAARAEESAVTIGLHASPTTDCPDVEADRDPFDVLVWLIWPTDGLQELLEAHALRILEVDSEVVPESDDEGTLSWTVTVKLTDVPKLRRLAVQSHPDKAELIESSLAIAWQHAADPFAPLRSIPGIVWRPTEVVAHHIPRRARPGNADPT
ncbi:MAG: hypothetical protein ACRDOY_03300 [Nocardioidaceae bacterium]